MSGSLLFGIRLSFPLLNFDCVRPAGQFLLQISVSVILLSTQPKFYVSLFPVVTTVGFYCPFLPLALADAMRSKAL